MTKARMNMLLATTAVLALSACGGGGTSDGSALNPTTSLPVTTLKTYNDGSGVISASPDLGSEGGPSNVIVAAEDLIAAREVAQGTINSQVVPGSFATDGRFYVIQRTGTSSSGDSLIVTTSGENLNIQGTEYVAISTVSINNSQGISSAGSQVNGMPAGIFSYTGTASVIDAVGGTVGDGSFTMTANFDTNTGTIAATVPANNPVGLNNPAFFFSANDIKISQADGSFSSTNAAIGKTGVTSESASLNGFFAGTNASGVHGLVYTNDAAAATYLGAFYGSR